MDIEECIESNDEECNTNGYEYIEWICGKFEECKTIGVDDKRKAKAVEIAKHRIITDFHLVGLRELRGLRS